MAEDNALVRLRRRFGPERNAQQCTAPKIGRLLTAYCFKRATEEERRLVEAHLLECDCCWREAQRLDAAVHALETDRSLMQTLSPAEVASAFGISGKLGLPFGGHLLHVVISCALYAALYAVALVVEIAYEFDRYGRSGVIVALLAAVWIFVTSAGGLAVSWKRSVEGKRRGLEYSLVIFLVSALVLFAASCLFLPDAPVTRMMTQAYTAQGAYLKTIGYFIVLEMFFLVIPFHFVVTMQRELQDGRHGYAFELLAGNRRGVAPKGTLYLRFGLLAGILAGLVVISQFLHHNLVGKLLDASYRNLFTTLIQIRLLLYYLLGIECLIWYYRAVNEIKRECLVVERFANSGKA